jgi:polyphosphate kinase
MTAATKPARPRKTKPKPRVPTRAAAPRKHVATVEAAVIDPCEGIIINRELSHLDFQRRVLDEARDPANPIVERIRFLSIFASNLDEFFMVRVAGLISQVHSHLTERSPDGLTPAEQLAAVRRKAMTLMKEGQAFFQDVLLTAMAEKDIHIVPYASLTDIQKERMAEHFRWNVFPVLTPLAFDQGHPFPHISNLSMNLAVTILDDKKHRFARLKVPESLPRLVPLKRSSGGTKRDGTSPRSHHFVWLEEVIAAHLGDLFPGMKIVEAHPFHVTRDADTEIQELEADDLLECIEESVRRRRFGSVVRLMIHPDMPKPVVELLVDNLDLDRRNLYMMEGPLGLSGLASICGIDGPNLRFPPHVPWVPPPFRNGSDGHIFDTIRSDDRLLHHPYDSFVPVVDFLQAAARDPDVLAIKQTLYRVGRNSPVVEALLDARSTGKQVSVLVELKARFDEEPNIEWARKLEEAGVHVIYGLMGLKTHSKIALVVRREGERIRRYVHLATGNYNGTTAQVYEDVGLFTADEEIGADASDLFNYLTGYSKKVDYRKLLVAPVNLRERIEALIRREIDHAEAGRPAHMILKTNALVDGRIIRLICDAVRSGVNVDLLVRGICCLRPDVPGARGHLRIHSVLGRFLEHSRIYWFLNDENEEVYLGSADLMPRNLDHRLEVLFPVETPRWLRYLRDDVLGTYLADNRRTRVLRPDGTYQRLGVPANERPVDVQARLAAIRTDWSKGVSLELLPRSRT